MFTYAKVAQAAAFFASKEGGTINIMKLMKLLYLSDRKSMDRYDAPITYDNFISMDNGPILSRAYDLANGACRDAEGAAQWAAWIGGRDQYNIRLKRAIEEDELNQFSDADIEVMNSIWDQFGKYDQWQLSKFTHRFCKEWKHPDNSSIPISDVDVFLALGRSQSIARDLAEDIQNEKALDRLFASS